MSTLVTLTLDENSMLTVACSALNYQDRFQINDQDYDRFRTWQQSYLDATHHSTKPDVLRTIGREVYSWLDGTKGLLARLPGTASPHRFEFRTPHTLTVDMEAFLHAPWELLADDLGPWAGRMDLLYCPLRRIGIPAQPAVPSEYALSLLFMAAAPAGADNLQFEQEEAAILRATVEIALDLAVEESGTLPLLRARATEHHPDVIHISCHGVASPTAALLLEDEFGDRAPATAVQLITELGGCSPRLLFLSACETAQAGRMPGSATALPPLTVSLLQAGTSAVLGWAAPVLDSEATRFAAALYRRLAEGAELAEAVGWARWELLTPAQNGMEPGRDWHLARLFLGPSGGGVLATGENGSRLSQDRANQAFLDRARAKVKVASAAEFVGRRKALQRILREIHRPNATGVLIHGVGRQGKSSLSARVADRLEDRQYAIAVVHGDYAIAAIVSAIRDSSPGPAAEAWCSERGARIETPSELESALLELLQGSCAQVRTRDGSVHCRPLLLIIDDLEQALEEAREQDSATERQRFKPEFAEVMAAVIRTFHRARTKSRLLFTSRFQFTLKASGIELANYLLDIPLPPMSDAESSRQLTARARTVQEEDRNTNIVPALDRAARIIQAGRGNPGLQNLLTGLALEDAARCDRCLNQIEKWVSPQSKPDEQALLSFFQEIMVREIVAALSPNQRALLRASTLFTTPVPESIVVDMAQDAYISSKPADAARLLALGVWDLFEGRQKERDVAAAPLFTIEMNRLSQEENSLLATLAARPLFVAWGGEEAIQTRAVERDLELTRLAVLAGDAGILSVCAAYAVRMLADEGDNRTAAKLGTEALAVMDACSASPPPSLLQAVAVAQNVTGEVPAAQANLERALASIETANTHDKPIEPTIQVGILLLHARILLQQGQIDEALPEFEMASTLASGERDMTIIRGDIADILQARGDLDEALRIRREEQLPVYERLGDIRERAVAMGRIADILQARGDLDEALRVLKEEALPAFERLGDVRSKAVAMGRVADILQARGDLDEALRIRREEELPVYERLGDVRSKAVTMGQIADILQARGDLDEALRVLKEEALPAFERLGDVRSKAVAMGKIADILQARGDLDEALRIRREEQLPVFERLGDIRERAVAMGRIADILQARGDLDEALRIRREEQLPVYERLGDVRSKAVTMGKIADILQARGDLDEALRIRREEELPVYERLGDVHSKAVTMGQIADILQARGDLDEALRVLKEEALPAFERLGDVRSKAVAMGRIADILQARGDLDEALRIRREEQLPVYERLGDVHSKAVTMGQIADILQARGDLDEALRIRREEELPIYERLGDVRSKAVAMGRIADILQARGDLDEALRIRREEQLPVYERLGDVRSLLIGRANLAMLLVQRQREEDAEEIVRLLTQAHQDAVRMRLPQAQQIEQIIQALFGRRE